MHKHICSDYIIFRRLCVCENEAVRLVREFSLTYKIRKIGGDEEDRTPDPLLARQVLSQLSYTPKFLLILRQDFLGIHMYCLRRLSLSKQKLLCLASFVAILGCLPFLCQIVHLNDRRVLCVHKGVQMCKMAKNGGPKWTRTTDLTLIRRAL